jgi:hypothetical protein
MPFPADFETIAGTRLFMRTGRPADNTETAFETYFANAAVKEATVAQVGVIEGREYNTSELDVVSQGLVRTKLGNYKLPTSEWVILDDGEDGFYETARATMQDRSIASFAAVRQSGAVLYWTAQVMNMTESGGGSNDNLTYSTSLLFQTEAIKSATPVVPDNTP